MKGGKQILEFILTVIASGVACALTIAWGLEVLGLFPFTVLGTIIGVNNTLLPAIIGPVLMALLYPRVKRWGLLWTEIMDQGDIGTGKLGGIGAWLMLAAPIVGWLVCLFISLGGGGQMFMPGFAQAGKGGAMTVMLAGGPFVLVMLISLFLGAVRLDLITAKKKAA